MIHLPQIPPSPGEPIWWWLFWFALSVVLYGLLFWWFRRHGRREDRLKAEAAAAAGSKANPHKSRYNNDRGPAEDSEKL